MQFILSNKEMDEPVKLCVGIQEVERTKVSSGGNLQWDLYCNPWQWLIIARNVWMYFQKLYQQLFCFKN